MVKCGWMVMLILVACGEKPAAQAPADTVRTCNDVKKAAERFGTPAASRHQRAPMTELGRADDAPEPLGPAGGEDSSEAMQFRTDCVAEQWSQLKIACFVDASTEDEARACSDRDESAPTVAAEDPACVAAANGAATALANDAKATGAERDEVMARARKAVLDPCLAKPFSPELLECLRDNEENFGICGFGGGDDWEVLKASLGAAGFGPKQ